MKNKMGIYKFFNSVSGKFYIGSTKCVYHRYHSHLSQIRHGQHSKKVMQAHTTLSDWNIVLLEPIHDATLLSPTEKKYLLQYASDPLSLNATSATNRGRTTMAHTETRHNQAISLIGKNAHPDTPTRQTAITFISPTGVVYPNVISINRFAIEHNLHQSALTNLSNGKISSVDGWTIEGQSLPSIGAIDKHWPMERIEAHYTPTSVIFPDNSVQTIYNVHRFSKENNVSVISTVPEYGCHATNKGVNDYGQGYRLIGTRSFTVTYNNITYTNVISLTRLAETLGINSNRFVYALKKPIINKRNFMITVN